MEWETVVFLVAFVLSVYTILKRLARSLRVDSVDDKVVFIAGCDTVLGRALAMRLSTLGFQVIAGCVTANGQIALSKSCPRHVTTCQLDLTQRNSVQQALEVVVDRLPEDRGLWAVVNSAGICGNLMTPEMLTRKDYLDTLDANLFGPMELIKSFLPLVKRGGGRLVNMTSGMGKCANMAAPYSVSKAALQAYLDILSQEVTSDGVHVALIEPRSLAASLAPRYDYAIQQTYAQAGEDVRLVYGPGYCEKRTKAIKEAKHYQSEVNQIVDAYVHALIAKFPYSRYVVGSDSKLSVYFLASQLEKLADWAVRLCHSSGANYFVARR